MSVHEVFIHLLSLGERFRGLGELYFVVKKLEVGEHKIVGVCC